MIFALVSLYIACVTCRWALCKSISACGCLPGIDGPGGKWGELCQWHVCTQTYVCAQTRVCTGNVCAPTRVCTGMCAHRHACAHKHGCAQIQVCASRQHRPACLWVPGLPTREGRGACAAVFRDRVPRSGQPVLAPTVPSDFHTASAATSYGREHFSPGRAYAYV